MTTRNLFVYLLAIAFFVMSVRETIDPDMWWHLRTGEAVLQNGVPETDLFSFTVPEHGWIVQQWLTDVLMWVTYEAVGLPGLSMAFALLVMVTFLLVYKRCAGRPYLAAFVVILSLLTAALPIGVRPQMFNMFFLALLLFVLEGIKQEQLTKRALFTIPFIIGLWANMHSGYLSGMALLAVYLVGETLQRVWPQGGERPLSRADLVRLTAVIGLSFLAAFINPSGYKLVFFPLFTLSSSAIQSNIVEWSSPDFHLVYFWFFPMLVGLGIVSWLFSRKRPTWTELLLFFGTAAGGLLSARHIPLFAVAAAPIVSRHLLSSLEGTRVYAVLSGTQPKATVSRLMQVVNILVLALMFLAALVWTFTRLESNEETIAARFPVAAVDFIEAEGLDSGRVYNAYVWGGYLIWRRIPVFIDGRTEVYGDEFFLYYLQTEDLRANWREPLDDFAIDYVLLPLAHPLATLLQSSGEWQSIYRDDVAQVLTRKPSP